MDCPCSAPVGVEDAQRLLVASAVSHTRSAVLGEARRAGLEASMRGTLVEVRLAGAGPGPFLDRLAEALTAVEQEEARGMLVAPGSGTDRPPVAEAMLAPSLAALATRARYAELAELMADERASFWSVYQPIVRLEDGAVVGHEALLRASGPDGPLRPDEMFEAAGRAGWLHVLDRIGRTSALRGARGWLGDDLVFVNFVPTTIYRPEVCLRTTEQAIVEAGLSLDQVVFEITEGERVRDVGHLEAVLAYYKQMGCRVALDDLGSGFSTLDLLVRLRPDVVKLDRGTVSRLPGPTATAVVAAVVDIAASTGVTVLAEGVETEAQAEAARALGVELAQGWHFGRPVPRRPPG